MTLIKERLKRINIARLIKGELQFSVEFQALQLRKIIEQIMLASLVANAEEYKKVSEKFGTEWNARLICRDIERINPDFFPKAVIDDHKNQVLNNTDCITSDQLIDIYGKLHKFLHANNPFGEKYDYQKMSIYILESCKKIINLLNTHTVTLIGGKSILYVVMSSVNNNGNVWIGWADKCDETEYKNYLEQVKSKEKTCETTCSEEPNADGKRT